MMNTVNHLQNAKDIGGTDSTPPLATMVFVAIKIGWINKSLYGVKLFFVGKERFIQHHTYCKCHYNKYWQYV